MKQHARSILSSSLIVVILGIGLVLSLFILINPIQADQPGLKPAINVAATAQALQTHAQEARLETARRTQTATWSTRLAEAQQNLTQFDDEANRQLSQLRTQLDDLDSQIEQVRLEIETTQQQIGHLRQTLKTDQVNYQDELAALEAQLGQLETQRHLERQATANQPQMVNEAIEGDEGTPAPASDTGGKGDDHGDTIRESESDEHSRDHDGGDDHKSNAMPDDGARNKDSD